MSTSRRRARARISSLNPIELVDFTRFVAAEVAAGRYPYVEYDADDRWHQRLYRDPRVDIWLISWLPSQGTQLHDHGGSSGAFTVLSGELSEALYRPHHTAEDALLENVRPAMTAIGFGEHYVHDVRNLSDGPAVSVHAYSPPLDTMNFYDVDDHGGLSRLATMATSDPEPAVDLDRPRTGGSSAA
ncbi:cysteine dioxygenase family protein [Jatrophihabitans telluris]|uniref:Cysteine dioxygenase family protein n=1 Tax=Jatrophihabitans telluris TaxID=2038343 RepID=A0ABY4QXJ8_9ACTN|nr:cysteine dioxygenase family protein [Jatrophihabitans telluris]UQX88048.1 cysteine dioxygenase family protein [Jatrophihabitans telluris]